MHDSRTGKIAREVIVDIVAGVMVGDAAAERSGEGCGAFRSGARLCYQLDERQICLWRMRTLHLSEPTACTPASHALMSIAYTAGGLAQGLWCVLFQPPHDHVVIGCGAVRGAHGHLLWPLE